MALNILVVDDDLVDRTAVRRALCRPGRDVSLCEANSAKEAIERMKQQSFDCVLLDYRLPDMDGISMLKKLYNPEMDLAAAPVVMLTGQGSESVMLDALRWGAQDYVVKDNISTDTLGIAIAKAREIFDLKKNRRTVEDQLRQSQKMEAVGQLTSGVAHDFNNMLTIILGNTRLIMRRLQSEENFSREDAIKKVQAIETAARKGADLVKRLMVFTRQRSLEQTVTDINACVAETYELLQRALGELIEVKLIQKDDIWPVEIDVGQFQNALINIAVNARDAMPRGGKLTVETHNIVLDEEYAAHHPDAAQGPYVMVAVSDTGSGMSQEVARRIFEPFFTTKKAGEGTGLGLSMVYGFIRQSGGHIHCYSEEGHGTVFRIYLPKIRSAEEDAAMGETSTSLPKGDETILVVEDDPEVRVVAINMLGRLGYKTFEAANGQQALQILKQEHKNISLIFTDIVMPGGMNGADLAKKAQEYYPEIKALYTSGYTENAIPDYQLVVGEEIIGKPYSKETLAKKIRQILDRRAE